MNAAETSASRAIADWTPLAVVCRSVMTAEIDTFISDVSTTRTNMAMASSRARRGFPSPCSSTSGSYTLLMRGSSLIGRSRVVPGRIVDRIERPIKAGIEVLLVQRGVEPIVTDQLGVGRDSTKAKWTPRRLSSSSRSLQHLGRGDIDVRDRLALQHYPLGSSLPNEPLT